MVSGTFFSAPPSSHCFVRMNCEISSKKNPSRAMLIFQANKQRLFSVLSSPRKHSLQRAARRHSLGHTLTSLTATHGASRKGWPAGRLSHRVLVGEGPPPCHAAPPRAHHHDRHLVSRAHAHLAATPRRPPHHSRSDPQERQRVRGLSASRRGRGPLGGQPIRSDRAPPVDQKLTMLR